MNKPQRLLSIAYFDSEDDDCPSLDDSDDDSPPLDVPEIFQLKEQSSHPLPELSLAPDRPSPFVKVQIYLDHYDKPTLVIVYFDTSAACIIINPNILSFSHWEPCHQGFRAANGQYSLLPKSANQFTSSSSQDVLFATKPLEQNCQQKTS